MQGSCLGPTIKDDVHKFFRPNCSQGQNPHLDHSTACHCAGRSSFELYDSRGGGPFESVKLGQTCDHKVNRAVLPTSLVKVLVNALILSLLFEVIQDVN